MVVKKSPIGISDFKRIIEENYRYIDKSLLIKEILENSLIVLLIRPRRFGKTLNMSLLKYFFEKTAEDTSYLFKDLKIWQEDNFYKEQQGKYPVIFLTFKSIKHIHWEDALLQFKFIIREEFKRHAYLLESLSETDKDYFQKIILDQAETTDYTQSLGQLSKFLCEFHQERVVILIDEYDTPINVAFLNGFYEQIIPFVKILFESAFKDNSYLEKGVITGIFRVAKEGIFSGLNNLSEHSLLSFKFADKFGFTQDEVKGLLEEQQISDQLPEVQSWYNGYYFGNGEIIYNPWSILRFLSSVEEGCQPYWVNTSDNQLLRTYMFQPQRDTDIRQELADLVAGKAIPKQIIHEHLTFPDLTENKSAIWNLLLFGGYLNAKNRTRQGNFFVYDLEIPNREVTYLYESFILDWVNKQVGGREILIMLEALTQGDITLFEKKLRLFAERIFSYHDTQGEESENFYHAFILGLLVNLEHSHEIKSNRESGYGRYDIVLIPRTDKNLGVVIELKSAEKQDDLDKMAARALEQILQKNYAAELKQRELRQILQVGIAAYGKEVKMKATLAK